ncbi:MAG TPA: DUF721 domain-containing protein [Pyrinomonadaceae bacterium]|nr:DUF721 domain-containing protein [Pyrinomonadaceae bacterium]
MVDAALLLPKILASAGENAELSEVSVKIAWRRVSGEGLRDHAVPSQLREKTLIVAVADAAWQKQLQPMSAELIFRINKLLRQKVVERIEFRIDPRALNSLTVPLSTPRVSEPLPPTVVSSAAEIQDSELRGRFMRAAEKCISRRNSTNSAIRIAASPAGQAGWGASPQSEI